MTTGGMEVDLDRLADYVGGALDGTPDAADVRHLVDTDPRWAEAHAALVAADAAVRDHLGAWGAEPEPMPDDIRQRLDAALAAAAVTRSAPPRAIPPVRDELAARRRRRQRWAVGLAAAAAVLVCSVGGVTIVQQQQRTDSGGKATSAQDNRAPAAPSPERTGTPGPGTAQAFSSGRDYSPDTLGQLNALAGAASGPKAAQESGNNDVQGYKGGATPVPGPLQPLASQPALTACLNAITAEYGGQVTAVDFAKFQGSPAVLVVVDGARVAAGKRVVVVVGPTCGTGGAIADERYRTTL